MDTSGDHMTGQQGDSPLDDIIQEDTVNDGQDEGHSGPVMKRQQNRKRKKKNQSLREMVF